MSESLSSFRWNIISPNNQYFDWIMNIIQKKLFIWKHIRYLVILIHSGRDALIWLIRDQDFAFRGTLSYPTLTSIHWEVQESNEPPTPLPPPRQGFIDRLTSAYRAKRSVSYCSYFRAKPCSVFFFAQSNEYTTKILLVMKPELQCLPDLISPNPPPQVFLIQSEYCAVWYRNPFDACSFFFSFCFCWRANTSRVEMLCDKRYPSRGAKRHMGNTCALKLRKYIFSECFARDSQVWFAPSRHYEWNSNASIDRIQEVQDSFTDNWSSYWYSRWNCWMRSLCCDLPQLQRG